MDAKTRRTEILKMLTESSTSITANEFSDKFGVTRQVIVGDIAILRANGNRITSAKNGYSISRGYFDGFAENIVCRHGMDRALDELYTIVDNGASVLNVTIEHPIYGQISGDLNLRSRYDVDEYMRQVRESGANQLSDLTDGVHIHTLLMPDMEVYNRITARLSEMGILVSSAEETGE